jgi:DNA repair exonuclease SbcCD ATPase subunit
MPVPPNWFALAAFGLLGWLVNPGLWLVGLGLEGLYLWSLSRNERFRATVDAVAGVSDSTSRYEGMLAQMDPESQAHQYAIEREAAEIVGLLQRSEAHASQIGDVRQMAWLHLKLLAARASFAEVVEAAERERKSLDDQQKRCKDRLAGGDMDDELRRSLEQQLQVIESRHQAHRDAKRRLELVDAELARLRQQVSLVREQALLSTDENNMAQSLDALSASLNEANRWLKDQRELFAGLDQFTDEAPPADLLASKRPVKRASKVSQ